MATVSRTEAAAGSETAGNVSGAAAMVRIGSIGSIEQSLRYISFSHLFRRTL
jgi:hypothetical protein